MRRAGKPAGLTRAFALSVALVVSLVAVASAVGPGGWDHLGDAGTPGTASLNGAVYALHATTPNALYVGGTFTTAGGVPGADRIARWNGSAWSAVSSPASQISNGAVNAIAFDAATGHLFVGGTFTSAGGNPNANFLAVSDGTSWAPFCAAIPATVYSLQIIGRQLYVAGAFGAIAGVPFSDRLVRCDLDTGAASSTAADAAHAFSGTVYALTADSNGILYAGGGFTNLGGDPAADNVAYMDVNGWHAMGSGGGSCSCAVNSYVRSLTAVGTNVYVGTDAKDVAGIPQADNVVRWNGSAWSAVGSNTAGTDGWFPASAFIYGMTNDGTNIYATGSFQNANGDPLADNIASFDGSTWHAVGSDGAGNGPLSGTGLALAAFGGQVVAGGNFTSAGGDRQASYIARYPPLATVSKPPSVSVGAPTVNGTRGVSFSATINPNGTTTTMHFEYGVDSRYRSAASASLYDQRTPEQPVGSDSNPHNVTATVTGLLPNATYHARAVASNTTGSTLGSDQVFKTHADPPPPAPVLGKQANFTPVSGVVFVKPPPGATITARDEPNAIVAIVKGAGFIPLTEARQLPVGTQVDARAGTLLITTAQTTGKHPHTQSGDFQNGLFQVLQSRQRRLKGLTVLKLLDTGLFPGAPSYSQCAKTGTANDPSAHPPQRLSKKVLQTLRGRARGHFQTRGRYSAATVRGTEWDTTDRCDGTLTTVRRGSVSVNDYRLRRTITIKAGKSYLARAG